MLVDPLLVGTASPADKYYYSGEVKDMSGPLAGRLVVALNIASATLYLASVVTSADGTWQIRGLPYLAPENILILGVDILGSKNSFVYAAVTMVEMS